MPLAPPAPTGEVSLPGDPDSGDEADAEPSAAAPEQRFRRGERGAEWRCTECGTWNRITSSLCRTCRTPLGRTLAADAAGRDAPPPASDRLLLASSLLLPGLGHVLGGRVGAGLSRALLYAVWLIGGIVLFAGARVGNASVLPALPLLGGAAVVWATSAVDAVLLARGESREILAPRPLLWLVAAVTGAVVMFFLASAMTVAGDASGSPSPAPPRGAAAASASLDLRADGPAARASAQVAGNRGAPKRDLPGRRVSGPDLPGRDGPRLDVAA